MLHREMVSHGTDPEIKSLLAFEGWRFLVCQFRWIGGAELALFLCGSDR